jgi:uncharacterized membrane protein YgcG
MKTTMKILAIALTLFVVGACSSSMQMSRSSKQSGDGIYYNPSVSYSVKSSQGDVSSNAKLAELEKRYTQILSNDTLGDVDTVVYKSSSANPYERVLSDSYQESYERRLRGKENPYYGFSSGSAYYSDDYWYASAYDPAYYNIIIMGNNVWVEPYYVSSMFGWPYHHSYYYSWGYSPYYYRHNPWRYHFAFHWGYGYPYNYWGYNSWYSPYHPYSPWNNYAWGYNAGYWDGYYGGNQASSANYHYGRRPGSGNVTYGNRHSTDNSNATIGQRQREFAEKQVTFQDNTNAARGENTIQSPGFEQGNRMTRVPQEVTRDNNTTQPQQPVVREPVREPVVLTRPARESGNAEKGNQGTRNPEPTSRDHSPSYTRPNPGNSNEFNRPPRNYPATEAVRTGGNDQKQVAEPTRTTPRQSDRSYNPPPRVSKPATATPQRENRGSNSSTPNVSRPSSGSSSGSSSTPARSSSGSSSSSSGSSSGSSSSSGNNNTRTR